MNKRMCRTLVRIVFCILILLSILLAAVSWQNMVVSSYRIESDKVEEGIRIAHISDLHSIFHGENQEELIAAIDKADPDLICMTGDIADDDTSDAGTIALLESIGGRYPCYYVTGNHECCVDGGVERLKKCLFEAYGVTVLDPGCEVAEVGGQKITVVGIDDIELLGAKQWEKQIRACGKQKEDSLFSVLLSHRPERVKTYNRYDFDLILSGHAHGGQIRIPGVMNGLIAPNQGLFPKYAGGEYFLENGSTMIVSRGLAKNLFPRTFNPPELVIIDVVKGGADEQEDKNL